MDESENMSGSKNGKAIFILIIVSAIIVLALIVETVINEIIAGQLMLTYVVAVALLALAIKGILVLIAKCKDAKREKTRMKNRDAQIEYGNKIRGMIDFVFDFGDFGVVHSEDIDCEEIPRLNHNVDDQESIKYSINFAKEWAERVSQHKNYFVNYFMLAVLMDVYDVGIMFWEKYRKNQEKISDGACYAEFKKIINEETVDDLKKYLEVGTKNSIKEVYDKLEFFDYEGFMRGITIKISFTEDGCLCVMLNDKYNCVMDVYEQFNKNLQGLDYHNELVRHTVIINRNK